MHARDTPVSARICVLCRLVPGYPEEQFSCNGIIIVNFEQKINLFIINLIRTKLSNLCNNMYSILRVRLN